jgi:hypothetical protein
MQWKTGTDSIGTGETIAAFIRGDHLPQAPTVGLPSQTHTLNGDFMAHRYVRAIAVAIVVLPILSLPTAVPASAVPSTATSAPHPGDVLERDRDRTKDYTVDLPAQARKNRAAVVAAPTPPVGTVRMWPAIDDYEGRIYYKDFTLRAVGDKIEVWVANDTAFPAGDCRNPSGATVVTDAQANDLVTQFDTNMYPRETAAFSTPPDRDGTNATVPGYDFTGDGDKTVTLVDNIRDNNFYDFPAAITYIGGDFDPTLNDFTGRNVMTIDAFDWAHRTGANPPNEPTDDPCTSHPAIPRNYEANFAHEYQHMAISYLDPGEALWVNEGLADFAMFLTGYSNPAATVNDADKAIHITCFQGFATVVTAANPNPRTCGGPENSLTLWGDGTGSGRSLADYGNSYEFMMFLYDRYGLDLISALHRDGERHGLDSLAALLKKEGLEDVYRLIHDYQSMVLLDRVVGGRKGVSLGVPKRRVTSPSLNSTVNLANPGAYATPGAAPNGADYVLLHDGNGTAVSGKDLRSVQFTGPTALPVRPLSWTVVTDDPDRADNPVLFAGNENSTDAAAVFSATVPATDPTLSFLAKYGAEVDFDYGYVSVSTDGGKTYTTIAGDKTVVTPLGPGLNGTTEGFEPHHFDLSAYAGQSVLISIRYVSDGSTNRGGLLVDDITVGDTLISDGSTLDPFDSPTEISPIPIGNWNVKLIGIDQVHGISQQLEFNGKNTITLDRRSLRKLAAFPTVVAVVASDEPTEEIVQYAPYTFSVNNVLQPGGA